MKKTTYRAILCNSAGELDFISANKIEILQQLLGQQLINEKWLLDEDDTIRIVRGDTEQVT